MADHGQAILNSLHISYLVNTIDFDSKQTRQDIRTRSIPVYLAKDTSSRLPSNSHFQDTMKYIYTHFPYEFNGGHQSKQYQTENMGKARQTEFFELYCDKQ